MLLGAALGTATVVDQKEDLDLVGHFGPRRRPDPAPGRIIAIPGAGCPPEIVVFIARVPRLAHCHSPATMPASANFARMAPARSAMVPGQKRHGLALIGHFATAIAEVARQFQAGQSHAIVLAGQPPAVRRAADAISQGAGNRVDIRRVLPVGVGQHVDRAAEQIFQAGLALGQFPLGRGGAFPRQDRMRDGVRSEGDSRSGHFTDFVRIHKASGLPGRHRRTTRIAQKLIELAAGKTLPADYGLAVVQRRQRGAVLHLKDCP